MNTQNLLVELLVEELPPKSLDLLSHNFAEKLWLSLTEQDLVDGQLKIEECVQTYATPRRMAVWIKDVRANANDKVLQQKLMPASVGLDANANATPALIKKLQALGVDTSDSSKLVAGLKRTSDGILQYEYTAKGVSLQHGLQKAVEQALAKLPIPKLMQYQLHEHCEMPGWSTVSFVRPAHGLVAMHGDQIIHITALGLNATATTLGHRFEALTTPVHIHTADSYEEDLLKNGAVVASFEKRRANIALQLKSVTASLGHDFHCEIDPSLLDEVTALVERPNVISCHFEEQFLKVPQECLILTMKTNQKYFPVLNSNGTLTNHFMVVSNISAKDMSAVKTGNERVVRPRLADAKFFYEQDCKKTLESRINGLEKVVYHHKLGNQLQRMQRVTTVAHQLASIVGDAQLALKASTAARLSKADLLTDMVGEFPELQGIMGAYYARNDGVAPDVAQAIEDHYKPRFAGDQLPMSMVGLVVAMADKMETLVGIFGIGNLPTGDKDPFALRRHALGVIRMLIDKKIPISIQQLIDICASSFEKQTIAEFDKSKLEQFFLERVANLLESEDVIPSHVSAVMESVKLNTWSHVRERLEAVAQFSLLPASEALAAANKRISNILKKSSDFINAEVNQSLLIEKAEQDLYTQLINIAEKADTCFNAGDYKANLTVLAGLRDSVDAFFNEVMVNAEDQAIRQNRLSLLNKLHAQMNQVADLSRLAS